MVIVGFRYKIANFERIEKSFWQMLQEFRHLAKTTQMHYNYIYARLKYDIINLDF